MKKIEKLMLVVFLIVTVICGKYLLDYWLDSYENKQNYRQMEETAFPDKDRDDVEEKPSQEEPGFEADDFDYQALLEENEDCIGWLKIDGTDINYPVVQGTDNEFYLQHDFQKSTLSVGL